MQVGEVQELIRQVGLAPTKARNLCSMSKVSPQDLSTSPVSVFPVHAHLAAHVAVAGAVSQACPDPQVLTLIGMHPICCMHMHACIQCIKHTQLPVHPEKGPLFVQWIRFM